MNSTPGAVAARFSPGSRMARFVRPLVRQLMPSAADVVVRSGHAKGLALTIDATCEKYYWTGAYETRVQDVLARLLPSGGAFWDVGAHIGFFSLIASRLVGDEGEVHAFEPNPPGRARLESHVTKNAARNVVVHPEAVAAIAGRAVLRSCGSSSMSSLVAEGTGIDVDCTTLDDIRARVGRPDVVKIDVEGAELDVLAGGQDLLARDTPTLIVEFHSEDNLRRAEALLPSYKGSRLTDSHWLFEPSAADRERWR